MKKLCIILTILVMVFTSVPKSEAFVISVPAFTLVAVKTAPVWVPTITDVVTTLVVVVTPVVFKKCIRTTPKYVKRIIPYGKQKKNGGHDARFNQGKDRNPSQRAGDITRQKGE